VVFNPEFRCTSCTIAHFIKSFGADIAQAADNKPDKLKSVGCLEFEISASWFGYLFVFLFMGNLLLFFTLKDTEYQ